MKISDFIKMLQKEQRKYGDLDITIRDFTNQYSLKIIDVYMLESQDGRAFEIGAD